MVIGPPTQVPDEKAPTLRTTLVVVRRRRALVVWLSVTVVFAAAALGYSISVLVTGTSISAHTASDASANVDVDWRTYSKLQSVSCVTNTLCVAVGSYRTATDVRTFAELLDGSSWSIVPTPSPGRTAELNSVSCVPDLVLGRYPSLLCEAVGRYRSGHVTRSLAEVFTGSTWTIQAIPSPAGRSENLAGISCVSPTWCVAAGEETRS